MDVLLDVLKVSGFETQNLHEECLRVLGRLGALDPYQYREISNQNKLNFALERETLPENNLDTNALSKNSKSSGDTSKGVMKGTESLRINEMLAKDNKCPDEKFNIRVAVDCIVKKFRANDNLTLPLSTCETIIQAAGHEILPYLKQVMPELHRIVRSKTGPSDQHDIVTNVLNSFEKLIRQMRRRILPYMDDIVRTMEIQWETPHADVKKKLAQLIYCSADVLQDWMINFKKYSSSQSFLSTK